MKQEKVTKLEVLVISLISILTWYSICLERLVARDEGFYLMAAREVMSGKLPYIDFFYPQTPLFPYILGLFSLMFDGFWFSGRIFSFVCITLVFILSFKAMKFNKFEGYPIYGILLLLCSTMFLAWFTVSKTYALSAVFLLGIYLLINKDTSNYTTKSFFLVGLLIGLLFNVRSYLVVIGLVPFALVLFSQLKVRQKTSLLFYLSLGSFFTLVPHVFLIFLDFDSYYFNNIGYHLIRSDRSEDALILGKLKILSFITGFKTTPKFAGYQMPILFWSWVLLLVFSLLKKKLPSLSWFFVLILSLISFVPSPSWLQYFSITVPFLVICLVELVRNLPRPLPAGVLLVLLIYFGVTGIVTKTNYTQSGKGVHGIYETNLDASRLGNLQEIEQLINHLTEPNEKVISVWPGYIVDTDASLYLGMENQFWIRVGHKLSNEDAEKYKIMTLRKLQEVIKSGEVKLVVVDIHKAGRFFPKKVLQKSGYKEVANLHNVLFFKQSE